jgi:hypothetical protein
VSVAKVPLHNGFGLFTIRLVGGADPLKRVDPPNAIEEMSAPEPFGQVIPTERSLSWTTG